jgi:hypothetical protein
MSFHPQRALVVFLGILVGAASCWLLLSDSAPVVVPETSSSAQEQPTRVEQRTVKVDPITTVPFDPNTDVEDRPAPEAEPSLCLVRMPDGSPAADTEVLLFRSSERRGFTPATEDRTPLRKLRTNSEGLALLSPLPRRSLELESRANELFGYAEFRQEDPAPIGVPDGVVVVLQLEPIQHLSVRVCDAGGAPAGLVQVEVREPRDRGGPLGGPDRRGRERGGRGGMRGGSLRGVSDAQTGVAHFEITAREEELRDLDAIEIAAQLPGREEVSSRVTLQVEGTTECVLSVPASLILTLQLVDGSGTTLQEEATVMLQRASGAASGGERPTRFTMPVILNMREGQVAVGGIEPGIQLEATTSSRQRISATSPVSVPSGLSAHSATVLAGLRESTVSLVVLDADGGVVPWFSFSTTEVDVAANAGNSRSGSLGDLRGRIGEVMRRGGRPHTTNAEGRAEFGVTPRGGVFEIHAASRGFGWQGFAGEAKPLHTLTIPASAEGGRIDLGAVRLSNLLALATGRVIAPDQRGVEDLNVRATEVAATTPPDNEPQGRTRNGPRAIGANGARTLGMANSGKDGRFKIYGARPADGRVALAVDGREFIAEKLVVDAGARNVQIQIVATGTLEGSVKLVDDRLKLEIDVIATSTREDLERNESRTRVQRNGTFSLRQVPAGPCVVRLRVNNEEESVYSGIQVEPNAKSKPEALQGILVGQGWMLAETTVRDTAGQPVPGARLTARAADASDDRSTMQALAQSVTDRNGLASLTLHLGQQYAFSINASGFVRWHQEALAMPTSITLERTLDISLTLPQGLVLPEGLRTRVMLMPAETTDTDSVRSMFGGGTGNFELTSGATSVLIRNASFGSYRMMAFQRGANGRGNRERPRTLGEGGASPFGMLAIGTLNLSAEGSVWHFDPAALQQLASSAAASPANRGR